MTTLKNERGGVEPGDMIDVSTRRRELTIVTIQLRGRLDALAAGDLRALLADHVEAGETSLVVDLSAVDFVDPAGLAALVKGLKIARAAGGDLRLVWPAEPDAMRVFELTKFDEIFVAARTIDELTAMW